MTVIKININHFHHHLHHRKHWYSYWIYYIWGLIPVSSGFEYTDEWLSFFDEAHMEAHTSFNDFKIHCKHSLQQVVFSRIVCSTLVAISTGHHLCCIEYNCNMLFNIITCTHGHKWWAFRFLSKECSTALCFADQHGMNLQPSWHYNWPEASCCVVAS